MKNEYAVLPLYKYMYLLNRGSMDRSARASEGVDRGSGTCMRGGGDSGVWRVGGGGCARCVVRDRDQPLT